MRKKKRCSVAGCSGEYYRNGFCVNHYNTKMTFNVSFRKPGTPIYPLQRVRNDYPEFQDYTWNPTFRKNRLIALRNSNGKCSKCGKPAAHVHHIDFLKTNHEVYNLMPLCNHCHKRIHTVVIPKVRPLKAS